MTNKEFIIEAFKRLVPSTAWHGDSYLDGKSLENIDTLDEMFQILIDELVQYSFVPEGNKGNGSFEAIAKKKQETIKWIYEYFKDYFEEE